MKRGLQDACHDGVRKKAKYLSDMPNEALGPGIVGQYPSNTGHSIPSGAFAGLAPPVPGPLGQNIFSQPQQQQHHIRHHQQQQQQQQSTYSSYRQGHTMGQIPQMTDNPVAGFTSPTNSITPPFITSPTGRATPISNVMNSSGQDPTLISPGGQFNPAIYDINDPLFNMDLTSLNFVNQYGALELGMLGHMSSGISEPSPQDLKMMSSSALDAFPGSVTVSNTPLYPNAPGQPGILYDGGLNASTQWQPDPYVGQVATGQAPSGKASTIAPGPEEFSIPLGYTISAGPDEELELISSLDGDEATMVGTRDNSQRPLTSSSHVTKQPVSASQPFISPVQLSQAPATEKQQRSVAQEQTEMSHARLNATLSTFHAQNTASRKRRLDASSVYETVKKPYNYINGFHSLINFLQENFSHEKTSRIAKALASIRPSFIACTQHLNKLDLVYMEKCFQRTLCEYEDFINKNGTPTIICRRTGEVAAVSREFTCLTGWRKEVLLGKEANLNVHLRSGGAGVGLDGTGASTGTGTGTGTGEPHANRRQGSAGGNQPMNSKSDSKETGASTTTTTKTKTQQPVFLAELLDEDSVIRFYEDFAHVAFSDSRGSVMAPCKLLRYRTKRDIAQKSDTSTSKISAQTTNKAAATATATATSTSTSTSTDATSFKQHEAEHLEGQRSYVSPVTNCTIGPQPQTPLHGSSSGSNGGSANSSSSTVNDINMNSNRTNLSSSANSKSMPNPGPGNLIPGESGLQFLSDDKGRVDCMLCWTVKRDMFEVPMLIVMNVSFAKVFFLCTKTV